MNVVVEGDTLQVLKGFDDNLVDLVMTSPPYNKKRVKGGLVKEVKYKEVTDNLPEKEYQKIQSDVLNECYRVTKPGGSFFYNHKMRWVNGFMIHPVEWLRRTNWILRQEIVWNRKIAGNIRGWRFWSIDERIYWLYKPVGKKTTGEELLSKHAKMTSVWDDIRPENNNPHPAPFPIQIPARIIHSILDENDGIVLDPYSGSGTTLIAAKILGKDYIGIELVKEFIEQSNERLYNYKDFVKDVETEVGKHIVIKSYKQRKKEKLEKDKVSTFFKVEPRSIIKKG